MNNILYKLSGIVLLSALLLILSIFYIFLYPFNPVTFYNNPFQTNKSEYVAGEYITYTLDFEKHMDIKPTIKYYLTDGVVYPLSKEGLSRPLGRQTRVLSLQIPEVIPSGKYHLQIDFDYTIHFRHIYKSWSSNEFYIHGKHKGGE